MDNAWCEICQELDMEWMFSDKFSFDFFHMILLHHLIAKRIQETIFHNFDIFVDVKSFVVNRMFIVMGWSQGFM